MLKFVKVLNDIRKDEEGTALIEYTILLGIIAVAVIGTAVTISGWVNGKWSALCTALNAGC